MRRAGFLLGLVVALLWFGDPALANHTQGTGINCSNFASQAAAQQYLREHPADPEGLDGNDNDRIACESNPAPYDFRPVPRPGTTATTQPPRLIVDDFGPRPRTDERADRRDLLDCNDFESQQNAQVHLNANPSDPDNIDTDNDGQACEVFFGTGTAGTTRGTVQSTSSTRSLPRTGAATALVAGAGVLSSLIGIALVRRQRRNLFAPSSHLDRALRL